MALPYGLWELAMKISCVAVGLAAALFTTSAHADLLAGTAIYSSFATSLPDQAANPDFGLVPGQANITAGSPLAQEFSVSAAVTLTSLDFRLSDQTPGDGGSILVYLVANDSSGATPLPQTTASGAISTSRVLLGTILDSSLPSNGVSGCVFGSSAATISTCNTTLNVNRSISTPGDYWIVLVNSADSANGGTASAASSNAVWWRSGDNNGLNAYLMDNAHVNISGVLKSQSLFDYT
jgi:hypothetical protein